MDERYAGLLEVLQYQLDIYRKLFSLAQEKQPVLIKGNISELERITKEEERLILQVGRLEEQRQVFHRALADHFALSVEELTLSELIKRVDKALKLEFQKLFNEITKVLASLAEVNNNNMDLINNSLDFVNFSVNLLTNHNVTPFYKEEEHEKRQSAAKIFDRTV